jgi:hypothetical protein
MELNQVLVIVLQYVTADPKLQVELNNISKYVTADPKNHLYLSVQITNHKLEVEQ